MRIDDNSDELYKHTLNLYKGDYEKLRSFYPDLGAGAIIRRLVRRFIEQIEVHGGKLEAKVEIEL